jgi:SAM-dependent methyltransferase
VSPGSCGICGHTEGNQVFTAREMMFGWGDPFDYLECAGCGCLQLLTPPEDPGRYYPTDYYSFGDAETGGGTLARFVRRKRFEQALGRPSLAGRLLIRARGEPPVPEWLRHAEANLDDALLDVGTGSGHLLLMLRDMGFTRLTGVDPYVDGDLHYEGASVRKCSLEQVEGAFDLVMFHHSLEHMPDPAGALREAARLTRPGRQVLVRVPVAGKYAWREYGADWVQLDAPRHTHLHAEQSLRLLGEAAGLDLERVVYDSWSLQFWGSEQYRRGIPLRSEGSWLTNPDRSPFTQAEIDRFEERARALNAAGDGDQACFYFRRADR